MSECPNKECHDKVTTHDKALFGKAGLIVCVQKKVTWKGLGIIASTLLILLGAPMLYSLAAEQKQNEKLAEIKIVKKDIEHIKEKLNRIQAQQQTIIFNQIKPEVLKLLIKEAVRNGNS